MSNAAEASALNVRMQQQTNWQQRKDMKEAKMKKKCEHCFMKGHVKEECFKIVGYPEWFKKPKVKNAMNVNKVQQEGNNETPLDIVYEVGDSSGSKPDSNLINNLVQEMMKALNDKQHSSNFAGKENSSKIACHSENLGNQRWIVDTGASDHMIGDRNLFSSSYSLKRPIKVGLPDGSVKWVKEAGNIDLTDKIMLNSALLVPDFKHNLLSVSKLIQGSNMRVVFDQNGCVIQGHCSEEILGKGKEEEGVYVLNLEEKSERYKKKNEVSFVLGESKHTCNAVENL